jgi:predicted GIY-YIG superfamily endonuclease
MFVYALKCSQSKWYVGQTTDIVRRFQSHKDGTGAAWTKVYPAESIVKLVKSSGTDFSELAITLEFMDKYGIDNVRGGPFNNVHMPTDHVKTIIKIMTSNSFPNKWVPKESDAHLFVDREDSDEPDAVTKRPRIDAKRHGLPWSSAEEDQLATLLNTTKSSFSEIAVVHERTEGSIRSKLRDMIDKNECSTEEYARKFNIEFSHDGKSFKRHAEVPVSDISD